MTPVALGWLDEPLGPLTTIGIMVEVLAVDLVVFGDVGGSRPRDLAIMLLAAIV